MTSVQPANGAPRPALAIAGGILAGLATLALVSGALWFAGRGDDQVAAGDGPGGSPGDRIGTVVPSAQLRPGDCINFISGEGRIASYGLTSCDEPHVAQVSAQIEHPEPDGAYPGAEAVASWLGQQCDGAGATFIGAPMLETTLAHGSILPGFEEWSDGNQRATCYVRRADSTSLTESVEGPPMATPGASRWSCPG